MVKKAKKKKKPKKPLSFLFIKTSLYFFIGLIGLVVLILGFFVGIQITYGDKILPGLKAHDLNLSGKTVEEASFILEGLLEDLKDDFQIVYGDKTWPIDTQKINLDYNLGKTALEAYKISRNENIFLACWEFFRNLVLGRQIEFNYTLNEEQLDKFLKLVALEVDRPAVDPTLKVKEGKIESIPGQEGEIVDLKITKEKAQEAFSQLKTKLPLVFKKDDIKIHSDDLEKARSEAEIILSDPLHITYKDKIWKVNLDVIESWIVFNKIKENNDWTLAAGLSSKKVKDYLTVLFKDYSYPPSSKVVIQDGLSTVTLVEGYDGFSVDYKTTITLIQKALLSSVSKRKMALQVKKIPREVIYLSSSGAPRHKGKAIVVRLSQQVLYCYNDGKLQKAVYCSTGIPMFPTPSGVFKVYAKTLSTRMRGYYGPGSPYNYDLPDVPHNLWFYGNYAIHGTYWHNKFGTPQSHGCINLPLDVAEWIYNWAPIGTPVYIY